ncbi:MAG: FecR domain-containing protein [Proteobacteria bacterium]|nr:FecR domain-containing protein [Pseudomonadota bacterium]
MRGRKLSDSNTRVYTQASEWFVEFRAGDIDAAARRDFNEWLRKAPENVRAYLEIAAIWNESVSLDPQRRFSVDELIACAQADPANVVPLEFGTSFPAETARVAAVEVPQRRSAGAHPSSSFRSVRARPRLFAACALVFMAAIALIGYRLYGGETYATGVGEQRVIALADGSTVELNTRSQIRLRFTPERRAVDLVEGQALFHVAKDAARPFIVYSDRVRVRAVGTQFDVYRRKGRTTVTVVEGRVAVMEARAPAASTRDPGDGLPPPVLLSDGEQVTVTPDMKALPIRANAVTATAWTQRRIVFESASLAEAAEEFNRYNARQIVIHGVNRDFHINGMFSSSDPASLVRFLQARTHFKIVETSRQIDISSN